VHTDRSAVDTGRCYTRLDAFLDRIAQDVYAEPPSGGHELISGQAWARVQALAALAPGARVLDVGCGQGVGLAGFREAGLDAVGVTLSEEDLTVCDRLGYDVQRMDQSFLEFSPAEFALVWCRHCLEHSIAPYFTLAEFRRVLMPGGFLYVEVPAPDTACRHEWNPNHYSVLGQSAWLALLTRAGFTVLEAFHINHETGAGPDVYFGFICRLGPAVSVPAPGPSRMEQLSLGFKVRGEPRHLALTLDPGVVRERAMLDAIAAGGFHAPEVSYFLTNVLEPGDAVVDVGAEVGYFSAIAGLVVGSTGAVFAFEPEAARFRRLERHVAVNGLAQVRSWAAAVGAVAEPVSGVPVVALDGVLGELASGRGPRLIRIHAPGSELDVIKGALRTIMAHEVPFIICEIDCTAMVRDGASVAHLRAFMRLIGYQVALLNPDASGLTPLADEAGLGEAGVVHLLFLRA
jgi:SAM-dependent methyltransferase